MSELERFDVQWDDAEERYFRDYHTHGKYVRAGLALERIHELESTNAKLREALMDLRSDLRELSEREGRLYAHFYARTCKALEPPR